MTGSGLVLARGKNNADNGQTALPLMAGVLQTNAMTAATVQVMTSDAMCFGATLGNVLLADGVVYKARTP